MMARWNLAGNTLQGNIATLVAANWSASIDLARPDQGLSLNSTTIGQLPSTLRILAVTFADHQSIEPARIDAYIRGNDLVVTYAEAPPHRLRSQIYWRPIAPSEFAPSHEKQIVAAFELIVSSNTSLLDADPQSTVRTFLSSIAQITNFQRRDSNQLVAQSISLPSSTGEPNPATPVDHTAGNTGCYLARFDSTPYSYLEMIHPADFCGTRIHSQLAPPSKEPCTLIEHQLFRQRLEKGVILRARIRAALVTRQDDEACALSAYEHFAASEPPLTV